MSLIVEDGSIIAGAESFGSVAEADVYHSSLGNTAWTSIPDQSVKEAKLRAASMYMTQRYRPRWKGWRATTTQALDWPRLGVFLDDIAAYPTGGHLSSFAYMIAANAMPIQLKQAQFELALLAIDGPLMPTLEQGLQRVKVGPVDLTFDTRTPQTPRHPVVGAILMPLLKQTSGITMGIVR